MWEIREKRKELKLFTKSMRNCLIYFNNTPFPVSSYIVDFIEKRDFGDLQGNLLSIFNRLSIKVPVVQ